MGLCLCNFHTWHCHGLQYNCWMLPACSAATLMPADCAGGQQPVGGVCTACAIGFFKATADDANCTACTDNQSTTGEGSATCDGETSAGCVCWGLEAVDV